MRRFLEFAAPRIRKSLLASQKALGDEPGEPEVTELPRVID